MADLFLLADCGGELRFIEAGGRTDEHSQKDDHEAQVGDDGPEGTPAEPVGIQVEPAVLRVDDGPVAVGLQNLAYLLHRRVWIGRNEDVRFQGGVGEERLAHPGAWVEGHLPQARRPVDRAGKDARRQKDGDSLEQDRGEDGEEAEGIEDGCPATELRPH